MLGDNPEKSKNPLKKAMRRRNAKTVNFAAPTYYEPSDNEWSDEEDERDEGDAVAARANINTSEDSQQNQQRTQQAQQPRNQDQVAQTQQGSQINQVSDPQRAQAVSATVHRVDSEDNTEDDEPSSPVKNVAQASGLAPSNQQDSVQRSRKGVVRNTDSFFRDDSVETKKISLTPQLLRGDSAIANAPEQEPTKRPSLDTFDKAINEDKPKDGKKKEKKGMLSGLFKRKDKTTKTGKSETDETDRASEDSGRSPQSKESMESDSGPDRKPSKLQKINPTVSSPKSQSPTETRTPIKEIVSPTNPSQQTPFSAPIAEPMAPVAAPAAAPAAAQHSTLLAPGEPQHPSRFPSLQDKRSVFAPIAGALRSKNSSQDMGDSDVKPVYSRRAKERFAIDESDSEEASTPTAQSSGLHRSISPLGPHETGSDHRDSEPRVVSPIVPSSAHDGRAPFVDHKQPEEVNTIQQAPVTISPTSPSDRTASTSKRSPSIPTHTPSTSRSTPTWSDASLRSYMDNDQDIRDLLIIIHDRTNVTPVGADHPFMHGLFSTEKSKLANMQTQLDSILLNWLSKKNQGVSNKI